jgi:very-long-chain (3R)-3-hydroxyacyl-CoA dehydratase
MATNKPQQPQQPQSVGQVYLRLYNIVCATLWLCILFSTAATLIFSEDISAVYRSLEPWTRCAQTLAVLEILHAATGMNTSSDTL